MAYLGYLILGLATIPSVLLFYSASQSEYRRFQFRARIAGGWHMTQLKTRHRLNDEELNQLLRRSGLKLSAPSYFYFRIAVTSLFAVMALDMLFSHHVAAILLPVFFWFALSHKKPFPMYYGFVGMQKQAASQRDRSLYLLYRLMLQEIVAFRENPISVHEMLHRQLHRVPTIRPFLEKCLDRWLDDPVLALQQFGEDLGTKQAKTFAHMLAQIEQAGIRVAGDVFEQNQESFRADRISAFESQLKMRALVGTALTMIGFGATSYDIWIIIQTYTSDLLRATMH